MKAKRSVQARSSFRPPTLLEVDARVRALALWAGLAVDLGLCACLFLGVRAAHLDEGWQELIFQVFWVPPGFVAWWIKGSVEGHLLAWVPESD